MDFGDIELNVDNAWNVPRTISFENETIKAEYVEYDNGADNNGTQFEPQTHDDSYKYPPGSFIQAKITVSDSGLAQTVAGTGAAGLGPLGDGDNTYTALCANGWKAFEQANLYIGGQLVDQQDHPGEVSHILSLLDDTPEALKAQGAGSHKYLDSVSDGHDPTSVAVKGADASSFKGGEDLSTNGSTDFLPTGMYHEVQKLLTKDDPAVLVDVRKNPLFDPSFKARVDRAKNQITLNLPLTDIFGICRVNQVIKGTEMKVRLRKAQVASALQSIDLNATFTVDSVSLWVMKLTPSSKAENRLLDQINANPVSLIHYPVYRIHEYRYPTTASGNHRYDIQHGQNLPKRLVLSYPYTDRVTNMRLNPLEVDLLSNDKSTINLSNVHIRFNGTAVPDYPYDPSVDGSRIVHDLIRLGDKDREPSEASCINVENWSKLHSYFGFDLSRVESGQPYASTTQGTIVAYWNNMVDAGTQYFVRSFIESEGASERNNKTDFTQFITK